MKEALHPISQALANAALSYCYHPDDFHVYEHVSNLAIVVKLSPHMSDIRLLIGADGRQAKAFNFLAMTMARRDGFEKGGCIIEESFTGDRVEKHRADFNPDFTRDVFVDAITPVVGLALGLRVHSVEIVPAGDDPRTFNAFINVVEEQASVVHAISSIFWPLGKRNGVRTRVFTLNSKFDWAQRKRERVA